MVHRIDELRGCIIRATDGAMGALDAVLLADHRWVVRYLTGATRCSCISIMLGQASGSPVMCPTSDRS